MALVDVKKLLASGWLEEVDGFQSLQPSAIRVAAHQPGCDSEADRCKAEQFSMVYQRARDRRSY